MQTFETTKSVYILTELITGGELHGAIRDIPTVLSRRGVSVFQTGKKARRGRLGAWDTRAVQRREGMTWWCCFRFVDSFRPAFLRLQACLWRCALSRAAQVTGAVLYGLPDHSAGGTLECELCNQDSPFSWQSWQSPASVCLLSACQELSEKNIVYRESWLHGVPT